MSSVSQEGHVQTKYSLKAEQSWGTKKKIIFFWGGEFQNEIATLEKIIRILYFLTLISWFGIVYILNYIWERVYYSLFSLGASKVFHQPLDT